jgi:hypothetical protein
VAKPKKWIQKSGIGKHKGALHRALGIPMGQRIPDRTLIAAMRKPGHVGRMAREAGTLRGFKHHTGPRKRRKVTHRRGR